MRQLLTTMLAVPISDSQSAQPPKQQAWWSGLTRSTSSGRLIPALDGLRCVAILAVIMHHLGGYVAQRTPGLDLAATKQALTYRLTDIGNCGVQLFFVISGFIVSLPFAEYHLRDGRRVELGNYFWRRITRLYPPYLVNLLILSILILTVKQAPSTELAPHLLASIFYVHNLVYQSMSTINGVAWSLEIEVQFYLLVPLLTLVYRIGNPIARRGILIAATGTIMLAKFQGGPGAAYPLSGSVLYYLDYFLCGLLLADWYTVSGKRDDQSLTMNRAWDFIGMIAVAGCVLLPMNANTWHLLPIALLPAFAAAMRGPGFRWLLSRPPFVVIGGMCYTIYLYHFGVISLAGRFVVPWTSGVTYLVALTMQAAVAIPTILICSAVVFVLVEKPSMASRRKFRQCLAPACAGATSAPY